MGSSWPPDEDIVIPYFNAHREMKLIIAPHEFDRHRLHVLMSKLSRPARFYSEATARNIQGVDCLIIDSFGLLSSLYRYGQAAYIGGGFGAGIHNINEAAVYGIPVIFGPKHQKFQGGNYGPYKQSERRDLYRKYTQQLLDAGKAYYAFDTPEELEAKRQEIKNFQYDARTRGMMRNSLSRPPMPICLIDIFIVTLSLQKMTYYERSHSHLSYRYQHLQA